MKLADFALSAPFVFICRNICLVDLHIISNDWFNKLNLTIKKPQKNKELESPYNFNKQSARIDDQDSGSINLNISQILTQTAHMRELILYTIFCD